MVILRYLPHSFCGLVPDPRAQYHFSNVCPIVEHSEYTHTHRLVFKLFFFIVYLILRERAQRGRDREKEGDGES